MPPWSRSTTSWMETFAGSKLSKSADSAPLPRYPHLTRCTGYRPILDAFKKFGSDAPGAKTRVAGLVADIEDLGLGGGSAICKRTGKVKDTIWEKHNSYSCN